MHLFHCATLAHNITAVSGVLTDASIENAAVALHASVAQQN